MAKTIRVLSRDDELLSRGLLSYFLYVIPRNFEPDIDANKIFYVAWLQWTTLTSNNYVVLHYFQYN